MGTLLGDRPAVLGGVAIREGDYPTWPVWDDNERRLLADALESGGWWHGNGSLARDFATAFAQYHSANFGLPMTNGTHTLEAALIACDVGEGDEVIVPGLTFVASAGAVLAVNATPVLADIDPETLCLDVATAEAAITERTKAIIVVHVAGAAGDLDTLTELCARRGLHLIEDCAHAHGTFWRGQGVGSFGSFGSFSMQRSKLMTAGEGGVLICNDEQLRDRAWAYADCGRVKGEWWYHHATYGSNLRMTEWQGAILAAQLERFPAQNARRNENAIALGSALGEIEGLRPQHRDPRMNSQGNYCFVFHYDPDAFVGMTLATFECALAAEGIPTGVSYPSLNELALFRHSNFGPRLRASAPAIDYRSVHLPHSEHAARSTVWLEHRILLADREDVLDVARAATRIQHHASTIVEALQRT